MKFLFLAGFAESLLNFRGVLIQEMLAKGLQVHVAAPDLEIGNPVRMRLEALGVHVHSIFIERTGTNPIKDLCTLFYLWRLVRRIRPDAVFSYNIKPVIYGTFAASLAKVPRRFGLINGLGYAFTGESVGLRRFVKFLAMMLYKKALFRAHKIFFQNPDDQRLFAQLNLLPPNLPSVVVNGSGVDLVKFEVQPLPSGPIRFLLIARLLGDKGVREYAEAAKRIRITHPSVIFTLVGWIDNNPTAISKSELDQWISGGVLEYLGHLSDVRPAIKNSSVYVLPSYREGTPRTVLEAMAMGRAIITTDAPGCRETVIDGENGFLVPVKSVDLLVNAMLRFINSPELVIHMGARSRQIAEEKYDVKKVNEVIFREMNL